ncbi:hypothetical protein B0H11DRAFT_2232145 [Mycena galericulata]|nr:hypothetical protein B0H11DRAFT_2232145 [Mycena galericulata]
MSLAIEARSVTFTKYSGSPRTSVSSAFYQTLRWASRKLLVTNVVPLTVLFSVFLDCLVVLDLHFDVLGVDRIRQTLGHEGFRIDITFNAFASSVFRILRVSLHLCIST